MKKRKYYPNNWQAIKDCPPAYFPAMPFNEFRDWKIAGYQLPSSHFGIVRVENKDTGKIEGAGAEPAAQPSVGGQGGG